MSVMGAEDLSRSYGETVALDGVSLSIAAGEIYCLIGPNGAGKTTLVRCLTGTIPPDQGSVSLLDKDPDAVDRNRIGFLPQAFGPAPRLSPRELVGYYAGLYDESQSPETVLESVGIEASRGTWFEDLSGGEQRRVCVATAIVNNPDVLVLDEPTTGIDPAGRRAVWSVLEALRDGGTTILVTTHDMGEATALGDRVGLLADGELIVSGTPDELITEYGGGSRLVVETEASGVSIPEYESSMTENGLVFEGVTPGDIGDVVRSLDAAGIDFDALRWREPDLEDVYLAVTDGSRGELERRL